MFRNVPVHLVRFTGLLQTTIWCPMLIFFRVDIYVYSLLICLWSFTGFVSWIVGCVKEFRVLFLKFHVCPTKMWQLLTFSKAKIFLNFTLLLLKSILKKSVSRNAIKYMVGIPHTLFDEIEDFHLLEKSVCSFARGVSHPQTDHLRQNPPNPF